MGLFRTYADAMASGVPARKAVTEVLTTQTIQLPNHSVETIRRDLEATISFGAVNAVQIAAVFACARVIAEGLATVPCLLQRYNADTGHQNAYDHPLFNLLNRAPNSFQTSLEFREWLGFQVALTGNAFVWVSRNISGQPIELIPLAPGSVEVLTGAFGEVDYRLNVTGNPAYTKKNIWHVKGPSLNAIEGANPQLIAARAIGLAGDLEVFGSNLFRNGARPSGLLTTDEPLSPEQQMQLQMAWNLAQTGVANAHKTAVLTHGLKFQQMQTSANDAQFIEARRYQTEEICRTMRVDPLMIQQATNSAAYASVEQRFLAHHQNCLGPWLERFSQSAEVNLLTREEQSSYRVHHDTRAMLRTNAADQANYVNTLVAGGVMTRNEGRELLGMDRVQDAIADTLTPAVNLFGEKKPEEPSSS